MSKKAKRARAAERGTWALCITAGLMLGLGMTPMIGNLILSIVLGACAGAVTAYLFTGNARRSRAGKDH